MRHKMSRAFVKEPDGEVADDLPDRPISNHQNFVTSTGLAKIEHEIVRLKRELAAAQVASGKQAIATTSRDLRYWTARRASAEVVEPQGGGQVRFGSEVTIERGDGRRQTFRITGEDEAEPAQGTLSYVAPLARALIGRKEGDEIAFMDDEIVVVSIAD